MKWADRAERVEEFQRDMRLNIENNAVAQARAYLRAKQRFRNFWFWAGVCVLAYLVFEVALYVLR